MITQPAYFVGFGSKVDGSASLRFSTNEIEASDFAILKEHLNAFGWLVFEKDSSSPPDIPKIAPEKKGKSLTERLYDTLFVRWNQLKEKGKMDEAFEQYRTRVMNGFIEQVKSKLEPL